MKITFLGTCAGTEPMPGKRHSSFVVEHRGAIYWFDAGESCSYTAHMLGVDLLLTKAIFITHRHIDHIGGLPNLLWTIRKLNTLSDSHPKPLEDETIKVFIPDLEIWDAIWKLLKRYEDFNFAIEASPPFDGTIFEKDGLKVIANHNFHLGEPNKRKPWESFSYRFEGGGTSVVYSGDVAHISDLDPILDNSDLLLMETGHHTVDEICTYLANAVSPPSRLGLVHHGRKVLSDPEGELVKARSILGPNVFLSQDGMVLDY